MPFTAAINSPREIHHDRKPCLPRWTNGALPPLDAWHWRASRTVARAEFAELLKERLWRGVPYHEWEEALILARFRWRMDAPAFERSPILALLQAYRPSFSFPDGELIEPPCRAPWTPDDYATIRVRRWLENRPSRNRRPTSRRAMSEMRGGGISARHAFYLRADERAQGSLAPSDA